MIHLLLVIIVSFLVFKLVRLLSYDLVTQIKRELDQDKLDKQYKKLYNSWSK